MFNKGSSKYIYNLYLAFYIFMLSGLYLKSVKWLFVSFIIVFFYLYKKQHMIVSKRVLISAGLGIGSLLYGQIFTKYSQGFSCIVFFSLVILSLYIENIEAGVIKVNSYWDINYILFVIVIVFGLFFHDVSDDGSISFHGIGDKNYTAIFLFLFFLYSNKCNKKLGVIITLLFMTFGIHSRSMLLLVFMFYFIWFFEDKIWKIKVKLNISYFFLELLFFMFVMVLSYIWCWYIPVNEVATHYSSLNDQSNRIRFVSNIRSFQFLIEDIKHTLFSGKGYMYVSELGVDVPYGNLPEYMGVKVLQAHNSYLNLMNKIGIIPSLCYFGLLGNILDKIGRKENLKYIIPFLFNAVFMHSLLEGFWVIVFVLVVLRAQDKDMKESFNE